jgi:hypothetical protein
MMRNTIKSSNIPDWLYAKAECIILNLPSEFREDWEARFNDTISNKIDFDKVSIKLLIDTLSSLNIFDNFEDKDLKNNINKIIDLLSNDKLNIKELRKVGKVSEIVPDIDVPAMAVLYISFLAINSGIYYRSTSINDNISSKWVHFSNRFLAILKEEIY